MTLTYAIPLNQMEIFSQKYNKERKVKYSKIGCQYHFKAALNKKILYKKVESFDENEIEMFLPNEE